MKNSLISKMSRKEAAKVIDSGCVSVVRQPVVSKRGYRYRLVVLVRRADDDELQRLIDALDVDTSIADISSAAGVPRFEAVWSSQKAVDVLEKSKPWLQKNQAKAALAIEFYRIGGYQSKVKPVPAALWAVRDQAFARFRATADTEIATRKRRIECRPGAITSTKTPVVKT